MPMTISGSGTITGLTPGGLPDETVTPDDLTQKITLGSSQATTSGTIKEFTGIPSWVKKITVMFDKVSTNGASVPEVRIGTSSGYESSGYTSSLGAISAGAANSSSTTGFLIGLTGATYSRTGSLVLTHMGGNKWVANGIVSYSDTGAINMITSVKTLSGTLDRVCLTTVNGTDAFDAGSVNIMYEG